MRVKIICNQDFIAGSLRIALKMQASIEVVDSDEDICVCIFPENLSITQDGQRKAWPLPLIFGRFGPGLEDVENDVEVAYADDLADEVAAILNDPNHVFALPTYKVTAMEIKRLYALFRSQPRTLQLPAISGNAFARKLHAAFLSVLPPEEIAFGLTTHSDARGSFTELFKTPDCGQISVNIIKPGQTKGMHWHRVKTEIFIVVDGAGEISQWRVGATQKTVKKVTGAQMEAVRILPGHMHAITNTSATNMTVVMWASAPFNPASPDTYPE